MQTKNLNRTIWALFIWFLGLAPVVQTLAYPRFFNGSTIITNSRLISILLNSVNYLVLLLIIVAIIYILKNIKLEKKGRLLLLGAALLFIGPIISSRFGFQPSKNTIIFIIPLIFIVIFFLPKVDLHWFVSQIKKVILVYTYGSFIVVLLFPFWALESNYTEGIIPSFHIRLHGLVGHANNLATFLALYIILAFFDKRKGLFHKINLFFVSFALLLTQSKTTWVIVISVLLIKLLSNLMVLKGRKIYLFYSNILIISSFILSLLTVFIAPDEVYNRFLNNENIITLTGRNDVWDYTVKVWKLNETFGYGLSLWDEHMGMDFFNTYYWVPPHAHSQFFQTLGESGVIGVIGLFSYLIILVYSCFKTSKISKGITLQILFMFLIKSITEPVFRNLIDSNLFVHFVFFSLLLLFLRFQPGGNSKLINSRKEDV